jgi:hypothetical protein
MEHTIQTSIDEETYNNLKQQLISGDYRGVEAAVSALMRERAAGLLKCLMNDVIESDEGRQIITGLRARYQFREMKKQQVQVTVTGEQKITVTTWYGLAPKKKAGRPKKGRNGTGTHLLLAYWGFIQKRSPGSVNEIVRTGVGSASYDAAEQQLRSQGVQLSAKAVAYLTGTIGDLARAPETGAEGSALLLEAGETLAGKRVSISTDGGCIRSRQTKTGRPKKDQKLQGYNTDWKEPKLLVISEMDETGQKKRDTKPVYEATMNGPEDVEAMLVRLARQLHIDQATQVVCISDGAPWIWGLFERFIDQLGIGDQTTQIVDFFHAAEHITELAEAHTGKIERARKQWAKKLTTLLRAGQFTEFEASIRDQAKAHNLPALTKQLGYFERHKGRMHYDQYEKAKLPIGSGIVESAVRRVINGRLKAPGTFWKIENVEKMLALRCALMAGRWDIFITNLIGRVRISVG